MPHEYWEAGKFCQSTIPEKVAISSSGARRDRQELIGADASSYPNDIPEYNIMWSGSSRKAETVFGQDAQACCAQECRP